MLLEKERKEIIKYGKVLVEKNLVSGTFGNLSMYNKEKNLMAISPSGMDYYKISLEDIVIMTLDGEVVKNEHSSNSKPSSEFDLHRIFYQKRPDIKAVVHTHSKFATTMACMNLSVPPIHYVVAYSGKEIPCTPYVQFGTYDLAESAINIMGENNAVLLGNHGSLAVASNLAFAVDIAEQVEFSSEIYYNCLVVGKPVLLSDENMEAVLGAFANYRQK